MSLLNRWHHVPALSAIGVGTLSERKWAPGLLGVRPTREDSLASLHGRTGSLAAGPEHCDERAWAAYVGMLWQYVRVVSLFDEVKNLCSFLGVWQFRWTQQRGLTRLASRRMEPEVSRHSLHQIRSFKQPARSAGLQDCLGRASRGRTVRPSRILAPVSWPQDRTS